MEDRYKICKIAFDLAPIEREDDDETINKAWYSIGELGKCLFKAKTTTPGSLTEYRTDWSEKVVERIANLLGLPVAQCELATAYLNDSVKPVEGVISVNCIPENASVSSGGFFLYQTFDNALRRRYTVENILASLDLRNVKPSRQWTEDKKIPQIDTGAKVFVGYLLLDALVHNDDRHGANWGVMSIEGNLELISSFDRGVSLGSRNSDEDKLSRSLSEHTNESSFSHFKDEKGSLSVFNTFVQAAKLYPEAAQIWQDKLRAITPEQIEEIFNRIPEERITPTAATFAKALLEYNQAQILNLDLELIQPQLDEQAILTAIEALKKEVRETSNLITIDFDEDSLSYLRDFVIYRSTKNSNDLQATLEYEDELNRRLFKAIENDLSIFDKGDVLNLKHLIEEEMENEGLINSHCLDDSSGSDMYKSNSIAKLENTNPPKQSQSDDLGESI
jgi:hypothetical protein